jgi:transposase-like protein
MRELIMTELARFHCQNCGYEFDAEVLTKAEMDEYRRQFRQWGQLHCPHCNRTDVRRERYRRAS